MSTKTFGVEANLTLHDFTDATLDKVENLYSALADTMAIMSVDLAVDAAQSNVSILLGIQCEEGLDSHEFILGIAKDAIVRALTTVGLPPLSRHDASALEEAHILAFA